MPVLCKSVVITVRLPLLLNLSCNMMANKVNKPLAIANYLKLFFTAIAV